MKDIKERLLGSSVIAGLALTAFAVTAPTSAAFAQAEDDDETVIYVTGSRIARKEFTSSAPVTTVGEQQIDITATVNTEGLLNTLPQTVPGFDRTSNNPGSGTATVDLRGLGANRTLVLMNGKRMVPTSQAGTVDINNVPTSLIKSVEVLTGGASAVYGSDAVAGVVNFIMKDDFEGMELSGSYEVTEQNDAAIYSTDLTIGGNFADGRGNVVMNASWTQREDLFQGDRDFTFFTQFDDGAGGLFNGGSSGIPGTSVFAGGAVGPGTTMDCASEGITFDTDGSIRCFVDSGDNNDFFNFAPFNYIQLPQERYQLNALGQYEINDHAEAYARASFTSSYVPQQLAPTPIFQFGAPFTIDGNPFLPAATQSILSEAFGDGVDTDGNGIDDTGTAFFRRRLLEVGPRVSDDTFNSFQIVGGVRGDIKGDWEYDAYLSRGIVSFSNTQFGNVNRNRFLQALLVDTSDATGQTCTDPSSNGATVGCAPINIFGEGNISADGAAFLNTAVASGGEFEQFFYGVTASGTLGDSLALPGGNIGVSVGYERRLEKADFRPSQDLAAGTIAGFNGSPATGGSYNVQEVFGELFFPVLYDHEYADLLEFELQGRYSDYSTVGGVSTYKLGGRWAPIEQLTLRGSYNTAVRAPAISELFQPQGEGFPGATDPCSSDSSLIGNAETQAICEGTGVPTASVFTGTLDLAAGQVRGLFSGNVNLTEETATTFTVGVVLEPDPIIENLVFSIDYFDIEVEDYITPLGGGANNVLSICYDPSVAGGGVGSVYCNAVNRRADGTIDFVDQVLENAATQTLKGVDVVGSYQRDVFDATPLAGELNVKYVGTFTLENDFVSFAGFTPLSCDGNFGLDCGEPIPSYKHRMTFGWSNDKIDAQLLWRHIGSVSDDDDGTTYAVEKIDAFNYFDLGGTYHVNENFRATFGIDNIFDEQPPILGDNQEQSNTYPATYDVFGRTYYIKATVSF